MFWNAPENEAEGILENTLIVFTSDNGPVLNEGYFDDAVEKLGRHTPTGGLKGGKYSLFDAGTHVPFITYWKGTIQPNVSDAIICQVDLLSSLAKLTGSTVKTEDSDQLMDALLGKSKTGRTDLILEASQKTALRSGDWVLIPPYKGNPINKQVNIELGIAESYQLFNVKEDRKQEKNLAESNPEKLKEMIATYEKIRGTEKIEIKELELK
ncbi:MAG: sulfatase-like hydrolase/transferase [Maribacter sp.]|uniref:sulfatase family protein n=1 Tax=Maribacter sp. TaxID=1897614 RepID=UPI003C731027